MVSYPIKSRIISSSLRAYFARRFSSASEHDESVHTASDDEQDDEDEDDVDDDDEDDDDDDDDDGLFRRALRAFRLISSSCCASI